jgi:hypothetical protein
MKTFMVVCLVLLFASVSFGQSYALRNQHPWVKTQYGAAVYKSDSNAVWIPTEWQKLPVTVTISYDTTAGTTVAYWAQNDDTTHAIPLRPGTGGAYGDSYTFTTYKLKWYRVKGAVPVTTVIR